MTSLLLPYSRKSQKGNKLMLWKHESKHPDELKARAEAKAEAKQRRAALNQIYSR